MEPTILLVEDEAIIRMMMEDVLTDEGFALVVARDGMQALSELEADPTRFRGVVTDVRLGEGPTGWDVARQARKLVPEMPIIYMTGGNAHEWTAEGVPRSVLVSKPFVPAQIITAMSNLLNGVETS